MIIDMTGDYRIQQAVSGDAAHVTALAGELFAEIMSAIGTPAFQFDATATIARLTEWLTQGRYVVFVARDANRAPAGFIALHESRALYAGGVFGTIPELYVRPAFRSQGLGRLLIDAACMHGRGRGWLRLEVTTPPLPYFDRTVSFYEREGFAVTGGRKLKRGLQG